MTAGSFLRGALMAAVLATLIFAAGCGGRTGPDTAATTAQLDAAMERYSGFVRAMAADSIAAMYAPDGEMLGAGMHAIRSPDSIRVFLGSFTNVRVDSESMVRQAISVGDTESVQWGTWAQVATVAGRPPIPCLIL